MKRIPLAPEPTDYRQRIETALRMSKAEMPPLWRAFIPEMMSAYNELCAYSNMRIFPTDIPTIDHFLPRSLRPDLAYCWSNYRLCKPLINSVKNDKLGILDPFEVKDGIFSMNFVYELLPSTLATSAERELVLDTIEKLQLNSPRWIRHRGEWVKAVLNKKITLEWLQDNAPFLHSEFERLRSA